MVIHHDEFGPEKVIEVYDQKTRMHGFLIIDNTALGPGKGGLRMTPTVTAEEVFRLARVMTWKTSIAGLPFGGAKSGIVTPQGISREEKKGLVQAFAKSLKQVCPKLYISAPDVNTGEEEMRWFAEANGSWKSCTGKPKDMCIDGKCGLPHELGSTGFGVAHATKIALEHVKIGVNGASIAIEGFGNVGSFAAKHLSEMGAKLVAVSDSKGVIYNPNGINFTELEKVKKEKRTVTAYSPGEVLPNKKIFELPVDVIIPAALPDVITRENVERIQAKIVSEGANIPTTPEMEEILHRRGVLVVPDFIANGGGVISSYAEYRGKKAEEMFRLVENKITANTKKILKRAKKDGVKPRDAAESIAKERVLKAMEKKVYATKT